MLRAARKTSLCLILQLSLAGYAFAQTTTYYLHKGVSAGGGIFRLKTVSPEGVNPTSPAANPTGAVSGKVVGADGSTPVPGATVKALQGTTTVATAVTNSTGDYTLGSLDQGTYTIEASATGYGTKSQSSVVVSDGTTTTVNLRLEAIITGAASYIYDAAGRLTATVGPTETVIYSYDAVGNLLSITRQSSSQLAIISVVPDSGPVGATVTISGTGFSAVAGENAVQFGGVAAAISSATTTRIVTTVPAGVPTGPIQIAVTTSAGTATAPFTVVTGSSQPRIEVTPENISVAPGDQVQFKATVTGLADPSVKWSVNGVDGGDTSVGTISTTGLYSSLNQPSTAVYLIRATSVTDPSVYGQAQLATLNPSYAQAVISRGISVHKPSVVAAPTSPSVSVRKQSPTVVFGVASRGISVRKNSTITSTPTASSVSVRRASTVGFGSQGANVSVTTGPLVQSVSPSTGAKGATFTLTITGANLQGATGLKFITTAGTNDTNVTATGVTASADGTSLTATVTVAAGAALGRRVVVVTTAAGTSLLIDLGSNIIEVVQ